MIKGYEHYFTAEGRKKEKDAKLVIWAGFIMYVIIMASKNVYTAEIEAIITAFSTNKSQASLAMTYYFVTYAIFQLIISPLYPKLNLKYFLSITLLISAVLTFCIGLCTNLPSLYFICAINGILQAGLYGGVMATISKFSPARLLPYANKIMSTGTTVFWIFAYGVPAPFVGKGLWNIPFFIFGVLAVGSIVFFFYAVHNMKKHPLEDVEKKVKNSSIINEDNIFNLSTKGKKVFFFITMIVMACVTNVLYYGIAQWIPSMLNEVFGVPLSFSMLITIGTPLAMMVGNLVIISICQKKKNYFMNGAIFLVMSIISLLPMLFAYQVNVLLTIICLALFFATSTTSRAINTSIIAFDLRSQINTGTYISILNAMAALMAGVFPPISGNIIEANGYGALFMLIFLTTIVSTIMFIGCSFIYKPTKRA